MCIRDRLIGDLTGKSIDERLIGGLVAAIEAIKNGANIIRTHDVAATVDAIEIMHAIENTDLLSINRI